MAARAYDCLQGDLWTTGNQQVGLRHAPIPPRRQTGRADLGWRDSQRKCFVPRGTHSFPVAKRRPGRLREPRLRGPAREILFGRVFRLAVRGHETATPLRRSREFQEIPVASLSSPKGQTRDAINSRVCSGRGSHVKKCPLWAKSGHSRLPGALENGVSSSESCHGRLPGERAFRKWISISLVKEEEFHDLSDH